MKRKKWYWYVIYVVVLLALIWTASTAVRAQGTTSSAYPMRILMFYILAQLTLLITGAWLGMEAIIFETGKGGKWRFNWKKFWIVVVPLLVVTYVPMVLDTISFLRMLNGAFWLLNYAGGLVVGHMLITCWSRVKES